MSVRGARARYGSNGSSDRTLRLDRTPSGSLQSQTQIEASNYKKFRVLLDLERLIISFAVAVDDPSISNQIRKILQILEIQYFIKIISRERECLEIAIHFILTIT